MVEKKLEGQGCWHKGLAFNNFICNDLVSEKFPFHFVVSSCPTHGET